MFDSDQVVDEATDKLDANILNRLGKYRGVSHLKRACMNILVKMATEDEVK